MPGLNDLTLPTVSLMEQQDSCGLEAGVGGITDQGMLIITAG